MKKILASILAIFSASTSSSELETVNPDMLANEKIKSYAFLEEMYQDGHFPNFLVDKGKNILLDLCLKIETTKPENSDAIYALTHNATEMFNDLAVEFEKNESEIETAARDAIGTDFDFILSAYGYNDLDIEEVIAPRDW